jgi:hypothetical protein
VATAGRAAFKSSAKRCKHHLYYAWRFDIMLLWKKNKLYLFSVLIV